MIERSAVQRRKEAEPSFTASMLSSSLLGFEAAPASTAPVLGHAFSQISPVRPQAKLTVNQPGDTYEQEADAVANQVMRMGEEPDAVREGNGQDAAEERIQRASWPRPMTALAQGTEDGEAQNADVSGIVQQGLSGGGQPLDAQTRAFMEPRFGHDFSRVKIHTDARAAQSADQVAARAYTVGSDIAFRAGDYTPGTSEGKRLLAHELTHVVQQGAAPGGLQKKAISSVVEIRGLVQRDPRPSILGRLSIRPPTSTARIRPIPPCQGQQPRQATPSSSTAVRRPASSPFSACLAVLPKMKKSYDKFEKIATMLEDQGKGTGGWLGKKEDKPLLAAAENIATFAKGVSGLSDALTTACNHPDAQAMKKGDNGVGYALNIIKASETVANLCDSTKDLENLHEKKDLASAEAWARDIGSAFDNLSGAFPSEGLPGFDVAYIKGLMQLPKNVINSFINVLEVHYGAIDEEAGISGATRQCYSILKNKITWEGDLCSMYAGTWTQPSGDKLMNFMEEHRKTEGVDLWKVTVPVGRAMLLAAIQRVGRTVVNDPAVIDAWMAYIGKAD